MLGTDRRSIASFRSSLKKAHTSKSRWSPGDNYKPDGRSPSESCNRPCREQSPRTTETIDCWHTTMSLPIAKRPAPEQQKALTDRPRRATGTRETHQADTIE